LDERFHFYYGDMDLSRRLWEAGWHQAVDWDAHAVHVGGASTSLHDGPGWFESYHASRMLYLRKHYPLGWRLYSGVWALRALLHSGVWVARAGLRRGRGDGDGSRAALAWARAFLRSAVASPR
jgi:GT2 family glycosyltransferase